MSGRLSKSSQFSPGLPPPLAVKSIGEEIATRKKVLYPELGAVVYLGKNLGAQGVDVAWQLTIKDDSS